MGLFSAIGSFFGPVGTIFGALADTTIAKKQVRRQNAAREAAYKRQLAQDEKNRKLAKQDASNKFVDMNAAAKKAGINPLTALRATGGAGFGMYGGMTAVAPVLSRFNFATTFAKNVGQVFLDKKQNEPIDKYNTAVRNLELQQRVMDLKISKKTLDNFGKPTTSIEPKTVPLVDRNGELMTDRNGNPIFVPAETNEVIPKYKLVYDQATGETYAIINPEITESGVSEMLTGLGIDAAARSAHQTGTDFSYRGFGFPADPFGLNRGIFTTDNRSMGWPQPAQ